MKIHPSVVTTSMVPPSGSQVSPLRDWARKPGQRGGVVVPVLPVVPVGAGVDVGFGSGMNVTE
jgi:hypothetical protein